MATKLSGVKIGDTELKVEICVEEGIYKTMKLALVSEAEKEKCRTVFVSDLPSGMAFESLKEILNVGQVACFKEVVNEESQKKNVFIEFSSSDAAFKNSIGNHEKLKELGAK